MVKRSNLLLSCVVFATFMLMCKTPKRDFFSEMDSSIKNIRIDSVSFFIKDFSLDNTSTLINNKNYWKLNNSDQSYFRLEGYLRKENACIMIVPSGYDTRNVIEYKLFDFNKKKDNFWKVVYNLKRNGSMFGDSIVLSKIKYDKIEGYVYTYDFYPYVCYGNSKLINYYDPAFRLDVNKNKGIIGISSLDSKRLRIKYHLILSPKQKFISNPSNELNL